MSMPALYRLGQQIQAACAHDQYLIMGMAGFGDNIYQRGLVKGVSMDRTWLSTPFPELYSDLGLRCVRPNSKLHTQAKHEAASSHAWQTAPNGAIPVVVHYSNADLELMHPFSITGGMGRRLQRLLPVDYQPVFDLPPLPPSRHPGCAVIRPTTLRPEWPSPARSCKSQYITEATELLNAAGYETVAIAGCVPGKEWLDGSPPPAQHNYLNGELPIMEALSLVAEAALVVTPVGWALPAGLAGQVSTACILGGYGAHNAPYQLSHPNINNDRVMWFRPDNYCRCNDMQHKCDKTITNFKDKFSQWTTTL